METKQLNSSFLKSASWAAGELIITFKNGKSFIYLVEKRDHFDNIDKTEDGNTPGKYYTTYIKGKINVKKEDVPGTIGGLINPDDLPI